MPVNREQDADGTLQAFDVTVERGPESAGLVGRDERVDHDERVGNLGIDGADDLRPVDSGLPFGVHGRPAPEAGTQLDDFHPGKT